LTDIQGLEDHLGDMDFKVAGSARGITAIQLDLKIKGLDTDSIRQVLERAKKAREFILAKMIEAIAKPKPELSPYAPRVVIIQIPKDKIGLVIGPQGKTIRKIIEETGVEINIEDDGRVFITSPDKDALELAKKKIEDITFEPKVGDLFLGKVTRIMNFGAFVEIVPGKEGLLHISQISDRRIKNVENVLKVGDEILVKLVEIDSMGRLNLSKKAITETEEKGWKKSKK